ncbi:MAG: hypothetical protein V9H26_28465 [Verrucomicrobiota bacterium]
MSFALRNPKDLPGSNDRAAARSYSLFVALSLAVTSLPGFAQTNLGLWPPVQTKGSTIRVWGRSYALAPTGPAPVN